MKDGRMYTRSLLAVTFVLGTTSAAIAQSSSGSGHPKQQRSTSGQTETSTDSTGQHNTTTRESSGKQIHEKPTVDKDKSVDNTQKDSGKAPSETRVPMGSGGGGVTGAVGR